jgi:hypothetical protein
MKNFLILFLAVGLLGAAFLSRPDREEFERYLERRLAEASGNTVAPSLDDVVFKDYVLWTVVRNKDGRTLYTGVFDRWIDNERVRQMLPS